MLSPLTPLTPGHSRPVFVLTCIRRARDSSSTTMSTVFRLPKVTTAFIPLRHISEATAYSPASPIRYFSTILSPFNWAYHHLKFFGQEITYLINGLLITSFNDQSLEGVWRFKLPSRWVCSVVAGPAPRRGRPTPGPRTYRRASPPGGRS